MTPSEQPKTKTEPVNLDTLGGRIAYYRGLTGLSQHDLSDAIGMSSWAVSFWENDKRVPRYDALQRLFVLFRAREVLTGWEDLMGDEAVESVPLGRQLDGKSLGARIKALRQKTGMSRRKFAEAIDASPWAVARWEQDSKVPAYSALHAMGLLFAANDSRFTWGWLMEADIALIEAQLEAGDG